MSDYSALDYDTRLEIGKQMEGWVKSELQTYDIKISEATAQEDMYEKIDGHYEGQPVQIKTRETGRDILYELVLEHDRKKSIKEHLKKRSTQGRDYKGSKVKHYFVLNENKTQIYHITAQAIRDAVLAAVAELDLYPEYNGCLHRAYKASNGVDLRPTQDHRSKTLKVVAFIPPQSVALAVYRTRPEQAPQHSQNK